MEVRVETNALARGEREAVDSNMSHLGHEAGSLEGVCKRVKQASIEEKLLDDNDDVARCCNNVRDEL